MLLRLINNNCRRKVDSVLEMPIELFYFWLVASQYYKKLNWTGGFQNQISGKTDSKANENMTILFKLSLNHQSDKGERKNLMLGFRALLILDFTDFCSIKLMTKGCLEL